jgi:hypothetical protein
MVFLFLALGNNYSLALIRTHILLLTHQPQVDPIEAVATPEKELQSTIQQLADDICNSVPFHIGDQFQPSPIGDKGTKFPHLPGETTSNLHYRMAPAVGGFAVLKSFGELLSLKLELREGQKEWINGQIIRLANIYNLRRILEERDALQMKNLLRGGIVGICT